LNRPGLIAVVPRNSAANDASLVSIEGEKLAAEVLSYRWVHLSAQVSNTGDPDLDHSTEVAEEHCAKWPGESPRHFDDRMPSSAASAGEMSVIIFTSIYAIAGADIGTNFCSTNSSIPVVPPSRPSPDSFTPPKGAAGLDTVPEFTPTTPTSNRSDTRRVRSGSLV
jgi:hypothetical protein